MKKIIWTNGLIAGLIVTLFMVIGTFAMYNDPNFEVSQILGYLGMLISFSFIFIGIKQHRDKQLSGSITFGKAFGTGLFIALIASTMYVVVWLIEYQFFMPDFMEKYADFVIKQAEESGATLADIEAKRQEMEKISNWYKNPFLRTLMTYAEILPLGILVSLISALILKKNPNPQL